MIKDFSFLNYMLDENKMMSDEILNALLGEWITNAKKYYATKDKTYFIYRFDNTNAGILLKIRNTGDNKGELKDFQPIVFGNESIKCRISNINKEKEQCTLLVDDRCLIVCSMDPLDFTKDEEVYVYLNFFASRVEFRKDEDDYNNHLQKSDNGSFNIFNIAVGELLPPIGIIKGDREHFPYIKDEMLDNFDDSFMIGSGKIVNSSMIEPKLKLQYQTDLPNNELPLGKCDCYEFQSKIGSIPAIVEDDAIQQFFQSSGIDKFKLDENAIIKVYGYIGAFIDINKTKSQK